MLLQDTLEQNKTNTANKKPILEPFHTSFVNPPKNYQYFRNKTRFFGKALNETSLSLLNTIPQHNFIHLLDY